MKKIIFGLLLVLAAVCILLSALGVEIGVVGTLSYVEILLTAILIGFAVLSLTNHSWMLFPFFPMLIFFFLEDNIAEWLGRGGENLISNWLVFGCVCIISVGIGFISSAVRKRKYFAVTSNAKRDRVSCGSESRYIDCATFSKFEYSVKMGDGHIYFKNSESYTGDGILEIHCSMGNLAVHVPTGWNIDCDVSTNLGALSLPNINYPDGPKLKITGKISLEM